MFNKKILEFNFNTFNKFTENVNFEDICKGRKGAVLVDSRDKIPLVRTTTKYNNSVQLFTNNHNELIEKLPGKFNNALIELYTPQYSKMGFHTDQALDLQDDSIICLFSAYKTTEYNIRKLKIKNKINGKITDILLDHNSIVYFSININSEHLHQIILENKEYTNDEWLGITFRLSKTFIKFVNEIPYFIDTDKKLYLANNDEKKKFYKYKSSENKLIKYIYPKIYYTISKSDIYPIM